MTTKAAHFAPPTDSQSADEMRFALSTLVTALNGIEREIPKVGEATVRNSLACFHGLAEHAMGLLFKPEPEEAPPAHHPNGNGNGVAHAPSSGRGRPPEVPTGKKTRAKSGKVRCPCGKVTTPGPMARHKQVCPSAQKAKKA